MNEPAVPRDALPPGTRIQEFEFREVLGRGGFGITYLGWDSRLERVMAIKEYMPAGFAVRDSEWSVHPTTGEDRGTYEWGLDRFLEEARMLARFDRAPGVVDVKRIFEANRTAYTVMEYLEGGTLSAVLRPGKPLSEDRLRAILSPLLEALDQVHAAGFIHRDIKPGNIMFRGDAIPVLIDFGAARAAIAGRSQSITAIVSPPFSPIELYSASTESRKGPWTDIYALGAVLYRGMTGVLPPEAPERFLEDRLVPSAEAAGPAYSETLTGAVDRALQMRIEDRPQSVRDWLEILDPAASATQHSQPPPEPDRSRSGGKPTDPKPPGPVEPAAGHRKRRRAPLFAVLGLAAAVAVGGAVYWWAEMPNPDAALATCKDHLTAPRTKDALACYRKIVEMEPGHAEAQAAVRRLEMLQAWKAAESTNTVDAYFEFERAYPGSDFAGLARARLKDMEVDYWQSVWKEKTPKACARYLEIYPSGKFAGLARLCVARRD